MWNTIEAFTAGLLNLPVWIKSSCDRRFLLHGKCTKLVRIPTGIAGKALCRRILKGQPLYQIDTLVDLINLVSLKTGYSIGGFDEDLIEGDLLLGVGKAGEPFEAIGRGSLNIEGLPVYRDKFGGIGTPTSDEERTKITSQTTRLLMLINGYSGPEGLQEAADYSVALLKKHAKATLIDVDILYPPNPPV